MAAAATLNSKEGGVTMDTFDWQEAERVSAIPNIACYELKVSNGKYRIAPWLHVDRRIPMRGKSSRLMPNSASSASLLHVSVW
jgi:hypothetical protein